MQTAERGQSYQRQTDFVPDQLQFSWNLFFIQTIKPCPLWCCYSARLGCWQMMSDAGDMLVPTQLQLRHAQLSVLNLQL